MMNEYYEAQMADNCLLADFIPPLAEQLPAVPMPCSVSATPASPKISGDFLWCWRNAGCDNMTWIKLIWMLYLSIRLIMYWHWDWYRLIHIDHIIIDIMYLCLSIGHMSVCSYLCLGIFGYYLHCAFGCTLWRTTCSALAVPILAFGRDSCWSYIGFFCHVFVSCTTWCNLQCPSNMSAVWLY